MDLVRNMLMRDPKLRITAHRSLYHPFLNLEGEIYPCEEEGAFEYN
jgi:serine/threonine protein kinase